MEFKEDLINEVKEDFKRRRRQRRSLELNWRLDMNFLIGNQYCFVENGDIVETGKQYFWQQREVYNHIAPIVETRLSKLARVKANVSVRPATSDDEDVNAAKFATSILDSILAENKWSSLMSEANMWSEGVGTAFYKVVWDAKKGKSLDLKRGIYEGDVSICVCPPFEIFPESLSIMEINRQPSIMHVSAMDVCEVEKIWGKKVKGETVNVFSLDSASTLGGYGYSAQAPKIIRETKENATLVIERYVRPTTDRPNGRLTIVAGNELLYDGDMPYVNGENGSRAYPFVKQTCIDMIGSFFGVSIVDRIIPVQRAYNIVKNRKHEYMNRIAMGILAVEDGSVDTDNLAEEGLSPGKVLVYRQGSTPPIMLNAGSVPSDFNYEEEKLLSEFVMISGVSEVTTYSQVPSNVSSGTAINLLLEQDDTRISLTADSLRAAVMEIGKQVIRLYRQFALTKRFKRIAGENGDVEMRAFKASDLASDDLIFNTANELEETNASRKAMVLELINLGLLGDDNGKISARDKARIMDMLGFGNWEDSRDIDELHLKKARRENELLKEKEQTPDSVDNHEMHIAEHSKLLLKPREVVSDELRDRVIQHINAHREYLSLNASVENIERQFDAEKEN